MGKKMVAFSVLVVVILITACANGVHGSITCQEALATMQPCKPFLVDGEAKPTASCCIAVATVNQKASTVEERRAICECFKKSGPILGVKPDKAKVLPEMCRVKVVVPVDPRTDCSRIS